MRFHSIGEAAQPGAALRVCAADPVVDDLDHEQPVIADSPHETLDACACLTTFVSASLATK